VCVQLEPGSALVLYTDGLVEQRGETLDAGLERLRAAVARQVLPPDELAQHVLDALDRSTGGSDDVALLVLTWEGVQP
jgi:serine phosphatase RsbU (regulator of sigma subunit)